MVVGLIIGATGITGSYLIQHMLKDTNWTKIYAVSHGKHLELLPTDSRIQNIACDVLDENACKNLLGVLRDVTNVFYVAWVKGDNEDVTTDINGRMFRNILDVCINYYKNLQHIILQTGLNYYGVQVGKNKVPIREDDPRPLSKCYYYVQEDLLSERGLNAKWSWNVVRPHDIIGIAGASNQMNLAQSIAIYATLCKETGTKFTFPGTNRSFNARFDLTDAHLLADFMLHLTQNYNKQSIKNQAFNFVNKDESPFKWSELWGHFAKYFGLDVQTNVQTRSLEKEWKTRTQDWLNICKKYDLKQTDLESVATFWFLDQEVNREWDVFASLKKARNAGWTTEKEYIDSFVNCFDKLQRYKIIPQTEEGKKRALTREQKVKTTGKVEGVQQPMKQAQAVE